MQFKKKISEEFEDDPLGTLMGMALISTMIALAFLLMVIFPIALIANAVHDDPAPQQTQGEWK